MNLTRKTYESNVCLITINQIPSSNNGRKQSLNPDIGVVSSCLKLQEFFSTPKKSLSAGIQTEVDFEVVLTESQ